MSDNERIAKRYLSLGIQHWGQTQKERREATDAYLVAAGFKLEDERMVAAAWLSGVLDGMPWGKFEHEAEHLKRALAERSS